MSNPVEDDPIGVRPAQIIPTTFGILTHVIIPGTPPGKNQPFCPARPKGRWPHTDAEIADWVKEVIRLGKAKGLLYMPEAIRYFATHCFWPPKKLGGINCPQHNRVRSMVFELAAREYQNGAGIYHNFVDDAPEGI